jgi:hypothetical protein
MGIGRQPLPAPPRHATETFRMVPDRMTFDERLERGDIHVWCVLAFFARDRDHADVTDAMLADRARVSERTIRDSLARLERSGFISRRREGPGRIITLIPEGDGQPIPAFSLRVMAG